MPPKNKRKKTVCNGNESEGLVGSHLDFHSNEARSMYRTLLKKNRVLERGITSEPPFDAYIRRHSWEIFCKQPGDANITMACEFYANMGYRSKDGYVLCRGKKVQISPEVINQYYHLSSDVDGYVTFDKLCKEAGQDAQGQLVGIWDQVVREITQDRYSMEDILPRNKWGKINKKFLTTEMNVWYSFVASRLYPVTVNSEVQWERIRILYALKKNMPINVGKLIFTSMLGMVSSNAGWGLHSLVTGLCRRAGCQDRLDDIWKSPMSMIKLKDFKCRADVPESVEPCTLEEGQTDDCVDHDQVQDIRSTVARMEQDLAEVRRRCARIDAVLAHAFPESVDAVDRGRELGDPAEVPTAPNSPEDKDDNIETDSVGMV